MIIKNTMTDEQYETLRNAQRIVEDLKIDHLFGDAKDSFLYATLSDGLAIIVRNELRKRMEMKK